MSDSGPRKRMLDQADVDRALAEVVQLARDAGVQVALVGGVALQFYGSDRFTAHLDVASMAPIPELKRERELTFGGYASHTSSGVPVDVILRNDDFQQVVDETVQFARQVPGAPIPVASSEYALVMKMIAGRPKDTADIDMLLQAGIVDVSKARRLVKRLLGAYALNDFDQLVRDAEWRTGNG